MTRQTAHSRSFISSPAAILVGLGLIILLGSLGQATWQSSAFCHAFARLAFGALSSAILTAGQALVHGGDQRLLDGLFQICGSLWPLLVNLAGLAAC